MKAYQFDKDMRNLSQFIKRDYQSLRLIWKPDPKRPLTQHGKPMRLELWTPFIHIDGQQTSCRIAWFENREDAIYLCSNQAGVAQEAKIDGTNYRLVLTQLRQGSTLSVPW